MKNLTIAIAAAAMAALPATAQPPAPAQPQRAVPQTLRGWLTFYNQPNYNGEDYDINSLKRVFRWDYHPRSISIHPGDRWEICARPRFAECITLDRSVPDTTMIGIPVGGSIGSVRPAPAAASAARN